jgi:hypothetical protein
MVFFSFYLFISLYVFQGNKSINYINPHCILVKENVDSVSEPEECLVLSVRKDSVNRNRYAAGSNIEVLFLINLLNNH